MPSMANGGVAAVIEQAQARVALEKEEHRLPVARVHAAVGQRHAAGPLGPDADPPLLLGDQADRDDGGAGARIRQQRLERALERAVAAVEAARDLGEKALDVAGGEGLAELDDLLPRETLDGAQVRGRLGRLQVRDLRLAPPRGAPPTRPGAGCGAPAQAPSSSAAAAGSANARSAPTNERRAFMGYLPLPGLSDETHRQMLCPAAPAVKVGRDARSPATARGAAAARGRGGRLGRGERQTESSSRPCSR